MDFHEKRVVITGGSEGIGLALCELLASKGAIVFSLDQTAPAKNIPGVTHVHCDVTKLDDVRFALPQVGKSIDLLVNNAGIMRRGPLLSHPDSEFDLLFSVNAKGPWLMLKEATPLLKQHAVVVHVSSYRAGQDIDDPGLYACSKAAGEHLARCASAHASWTLKIARLGRFATKMALNDATTLPASEAAKLLVRLIESKKTSLSFDPATNEHTLA